jgi:hypothetical protein
MIVWIASYPKSGNTWVRSLLSSYLYSNDGIFNFDLLKEIRQFPSKSFFNTFLNDFSDIKKVSNFWIAAQDKINLIKDKTTFLKTHSSLCTLENNPFTNKINTKAIIYIVRDPRNLITSISNHYSQTQEESFNFMINKNKMIMDDDWGGKDFGVATVLGSWVDHYKSWTNTKIAPLIVIKYEDLINDTINTFEKILNFLNKLIDIKIDKKKITNVVGSCEFEILSNKEKKEGFFESISKNDKKVSFFFLGKKNNWKDLLNPEIEKKIRSTFQNEMLQLKYI